MPVCWGYWLESFLQDEESREEALDEVLIAGKLAEVARGSGRGALEKKALKATLWTVVDYGSGQGLRVVNSLVLTRLLFPDAFGLMTLVSTMIVGVTLLSDIGLAPSVIQSRRGDEPGFLNTAWTLQAIRGSLLWLAALVMAWPAAVFYHDRKLLALLPVLALNTLMTGFNSTNLLSLSRHMGVRRLFYFDFSSQVVALVVTVAWAYRWHSVWALVGGNVATNVYRLVLSHNKRLIPGVKNRFEWDRTAIKEIVGFGKWLLLGTAFTFFATQSDRLILGKLTTFTMLGIYGIAFQISDVPRSVINAFSYKVGYPFVAKIIDLPRADFRVQFLKYRRLALLVGAVLLSVMVTWGDLLLKLYKPAYREGSWMVPILAVGLWHTLLYMTVNPVLLSLGKSKYNAVGNGAYCVAMLVSIPLAFHYFGMLGAVIAVAAGDFPLYVVTAFGGVREGIRQMRQDGEMTLVFLGLLAVEIGTRHMVR